MINFIEQLVATLWNRLRRRERGAWQETRSLDLGFRVVDGQVTRSHVGLSKARRAMHIAVLGKTGTGKSSFLRYLSQQDIEADRGFLYFDLHGDATPFLLRTINARERQLHRHLSDKLILIEPADPMVSVGFNPLEQEAPDFVRIGGIRAGAQAALGTRPLRSPHGRTVAECTLRAFGERSHARRTGTAAHAHGIPRRVPQEACPNAEIRQYFELRYDQASEAMRATMREPILNKTSAFTADPHFRHIVGQAHSTFSIREAMDEGHWVIVNLDKGRLGEQALTLGKPDLHHAQECALHPREAIALHRVLR